MANTVLESATVNNDVAAVMYNVTCATPAATAAKTATASEKFALFSGVRIRVAFTNGNTASNPTLSINSTVSVPLKADGENSIDAMAAGAVVDVIYDGTNYIVSGTGTIPPVVKSWAEDTFVSKSGALTGVTATSPLSASTSSGVATVSHDDSGVTAGSKGDTTSQTPQFGGTFKALSGTVDAKGHLTAFGEHTVTIPSSTATQSASGLMSSSDKTKLDGIADGADAVAFTQTQTSGTEIGTLSINSTDTKLYAPIQTDVSGNAGTATALQTARLIDGASFDGSSNIIHYGVCLSSPSAATMAVSIPSFENTTLATGARVAVRFINGVLNTAAKLNVSNTGEYAIKINHGGTTTDLPVNYWSAGDIIDFVFTGTYWVVVGRKVATTASYGVTKLSSSTNSTSVNMAATPLAVKTAYDLANGKPDLIPTDGAVPLMDGTASVGTSSEAARADHVHPSDVTLVPIVGKGKNILDNWYFVGGGTPGKYPINSGGKLSYAGTATMTIDRWYAYTATVSVASSYLEINNSANGTVGYIWQILKSEVAYALNGQDVTLSVFDSNGNLTTATFSFAQGTTQILTDTTADMWIQHGSDDGIYVVANPYKTVRIVAVKFEIGKRQTLVRSVNGTYYLNDIPVNYGEELVNTMTDASDEPVWTIGKGENIIDNWYFVGGGSPGSYPVNSLYPKTVFSAGSADVFDRWNGLGTGGAISIVSGGVTIAASGQMFQWIDRNRMQNLREYTMSCMLNNKVYWNTFVYDETESDTSPHYVSCDGIASFVFYPNLWNNGKNALGWNTITQDVTIAAVKLELGSRQTLARYANGVWVLNDQQPNYQEELLRCSDGFTPLVGNGRNLIDNWYFVGGGTGGMLPVNQRGRTGANAYTTAGEYTIDRWAFPNWSTAHGMSVFSNYIQVNGILSQYLNASAGLNGYTVTASILFSSGGTGSKVALIAYTPSAQTGYVAVEGNVVASEAGISSATLAIPTDATSVEFRIDCSNAVGSVIAAKLEVGSIQTLARKVGNAWVLNDPPPNYQQELAKCSAYLHIIKAFDARNLMIGNANANAAESVYWDMTIPIMAKTPSLTVVANKIGIGTSGFSLNPTAVSLFHYSAGHAVIGATGFSGLTVGQPYRIGLLSGGTMIFSAE